MAAMAQPASHNNTQALRENHKCGSCVLKVIFDILSKNVYSKMNTKSLTYVLGTLGYFLQAFGLGLNNIGEVLEAIGGGHNVIKLVSNNVMHEASLFLV